MRRVPRTRPPLSAATSTRSDSSSMATEVAITPNLSVPGRQYPTCLSAQSSMHLWLKVGRRAKLSAPYRARELRTDPGNDSPGLRGPGGRVGVGVREEEEEEEDGRRV